MVHLYLVGTIIGACALLAKSLIFSFYEAKFEAQDSLMMPAVKAEADISEHFLVDEIGACDLPILFELVLQLRPYMRRDGSGHYDEFVTEEGQCVIAPIMARVSPDLLSKLICGCKSLQFPIDDQIIAELWFDSDCNAWHYRQHSNN